MRKIMLGSDWWTDCDDAVALRLLLRAHKNEEIELCAIALNACMEKSVASLDAFLLLEGNLDFPIGIDHTATEFSGTPTYHKRAYLSTQNAALKIPTRKMPAVCTERYSLKAMSLLKS